MIIKILSSASKDFHGVEYNENKVDKGKGELLTMKNFPSFINEASGKQQIINYFKAVSQNSRIQKPQFHAVISTKHRQHSKEELQAVAEKFMEKTGYGAQPYLVVFHKDTDNNHVHIVSTRISKETGKKIDHNFERLKSQKALENSLKELYGVNRNEEIDRLMSYKFSNVHQLEMLLEQSGYQKAETEDGFEILKNGIKIQKINKAELKYEYKPDEARKRQIRAILNKYKDVYSNKVFRVEDHYNSSKASYESELQKKLRDKLGLDIVFHHKDGKTPFGYTLIDHKSRQVFKGSEIEKMRNLFEFTPDKIDKKLFELLQNHPLFDSEHKEALLQKYKQNENLKDFMLFENRKRMPYEAYREFRSHAVEYLRNSGKRGYKNEDISLVKINDKIFAIDEKTQGCANLQNLVGDREYEKFLDTPDSSEQLTEALYHVSADTLNLFLQLASAAQYSGDAPAAKEELKKKRKRRKI
jgi:hypothetical protein